MKTLQRFHMMMTLGGGLIALAGCATSQAPQDQAPQWVQIPVLAALPMTDPAAQQACPVPPAPPGSVPETSPSTPPDHAVASSPPQGFCVSYAFQGQSFSVWLPTDPGEQVTLLWPMPTDPAGLATAPAGVVVPYGYPYPSPYLYGGVYLGGVYFRPRPNVMGPGRGNGGHGWGRRGGHSGRR
jgi:hypothetical protein